MASANRGNLVLQPNYFTSSLYVPTLRNDISSLLLSFHERYQQDHSKPFSTFKELWNSQGWKWIHFKAIESRSREACLNVTVRLFLERLVKTEAPFTRAVMLFALYTFFETQPTGSAPALHRMTHIPIPIDLYNSLLVLPTTLTTPYLAPLHPLVSHMLSTLVGAERFHILPSSELGASNPRNLPHEIFVEEGLIDSNQPVRKGTFSKRDKVVKARAALDSLGHWMATPSSATPPTRIHYVEQKTLLLQKIGVQSPELKEISAGVVGSLRQAQEEQGEDASWDGLEKVYAAVGSSSGLLRLVD